MSIRLQRDGVVARPTAWELGYADGRRNQPTWRKVLKAEYLDEYDEGFYAGRLAARKPS